MTSMETDYFGEGDKRLSHRVMRCPSPKLEAQLIVWSLRSMDAFIFLVFFLFQGLILIDPLLNFLLVLVPYLLVYLTFVTAQKNIS